MSAYTLVLAQVTGRCQCVGGGVESVRDRCLPGVEVKVGEVEVGGKEHVCSLVCMCVGWWEELRPVLGRVDRCEITGVSDGVKARLGGVGGRVVVVVESSVQATG